LGWLESLSSFFCGGSLKDERIRQQDEQIKSLSLSLVECGRKRDGFESESIRLQSLADSLVSRCESAEADAARFYAELGKAIKVPDIAPVGGSLVDPWGMTPSQWVGVRPQLLSDNKYLAYPEEEWLRILTPVQAEVKRVLGFPRSEVNDCDNWTNATIFLVQEVFRRAGLSHQGAFLKLLSKAHSYCGFMMPDLSVRVYDPMSGGVVGRLGETGPGDYGEDTYKTELAYFLS
jgi:hypothetical protein